MGFTRNGPPRAGMIYLPEHAFDQLEQFILSNRDTNSGAEPLVGMQEICEKALVDKLKELNAFVGVVVLMEVATGEVKAIVNMTKGKDGNYYEMRNNAISDMLEPGSTFKTASIMVALEDGKITPDYVVDTGNGQMPRHGRVMKDWNWRRGGYGKLTVTEILEVSSNVGTSYIIDHF